MRRLKIALLGLGDVGAAYLSALGKDERLELVAVADSSPEVLRNYAATGGERVYEDFRSLVVEAASTGLDLLFVASQPHRSIEFVEMAADRGIGVYHNAPLARNVEEARRLIQRFEKHDCPLVVSRPWRFEAALGPLDRIADRIGRVHAAVSEVFTTATAAGWRGDSLRAGGGVLLYGAYGAVDLLVNLLGPVESVYAQCGRSAAPGVACRYDTEDVVTLSLRFASGRIGSLTASRGADTQRNRTTLVADEGMIEILDDRIITRSIKPGAVPEEHNRSDDGISREIRAFVSAFLSEERKFESTAQTHLPTMAVISTAYLSARTGEPEIPDRP